jgi:membrane protease YdiL (CAAX protease family)
MTAADREKRSFHVALAAFVPVLMLPLTWWLAIRAWIDANRSEGDETIARISWARRLGALALLDTVISAVFGAAVSIGKPLAAEPSPPRTPRSPFEPIGGVDCGDLWREQALGSLWPVLLGCAMIGALWWRARRLEPEARSRWGVVLLPLVVAPIVGIAAAYSSCRQLGGWSIGVALIGVIAQGLTMLALGLGAMRVAAAELRVVVGPQLSTSRTSAVAVVYMLAGLARAALLIAALWSLFPELRVARDTTIEALLSGENGWIGRVLVLTATVGVAPVAEEILFRGLLLPGLTQRMSTGAALLWSSTVFALFHVPSHGIGAVAPGVLGLVFGWSRLRSGGLAAPILLHMANNLLVTLLAWAG